MFRQNIIFANKMQHQVHSCEIFRSQNISQRDFWKLIHYQGSQEVGTIGTCFLGFWYFQEGTTKVWKNITTAGTGMLEDGRGY